MNNSQTILAALRDALAELYPQENDARIVIADAGLDARQIAFHARAQTNWHNILAEAVRQNRLDGLLTVVLATYVDNSALMRIHAAYRRFLDQGGELEPSAQLSDVGGATRQAIKTSGGSYIAGNLEIKEGDFVGRDKVTNIQQTLLSETDLQDQNNRGVLRQMVKKFWIEDVLEHSLNHEAALRLHLSDRSNLVENRPWNLLPQQVGETVRLLPLEIHILDVFDQMNQRLLILGEPGAGKTTLLLELARALLQRADTTPAYPSPVVFNLSSWIERKAPLAEWLVDELRTRYNIPKKLAQAWVAQDKLLPLLDGLDEVQAAQRAACAEAINQFQAEHLVPLVVCSRVTEYENLPVHLKLQGAVLIQPLTTEQIDAYLSKAGPPLAAVRSILQQDTELQALAQSPLMLSIMTLAYQGVTPAELILTDATQTRRQHLFNAYIQRMFMRREVKSVYSTRQTVRWLHWLASRLVQSGQTIFLIERMQPNLLQNIQQNPFYLPLIMLLGGPIYGLIFGLCLGLIDGLIGGLLRVGLSVGLYFGVRGGLLDGLLVGLIFGLIDGFSGRFKSINPIEQSSILKRRLRSSLYTTLFWGLIGGMSVGLIFGIFGELSDGVSVGLIFGLIGGMIGMFREIEPVRQISWSWQRIRTDLYFGLTIGLIGGLAIGLISGLVRFELRVGLIVGVSGGLICGLIGGMTSGVIFQSNTRENILIEEKTQSSNQGIWFSARYSLVTGILFWMVFWLVFGLVLGLIGGLSGGLIGWKSGGLIGRLIFGLIGGLIGGGDVVVKHLILRLILWWQKDIPWNYARFLDYATGLIFLRKVGGGYIFVHRLIMEHFAGLDEEEIERIAKSSTFR